MADSSASVSLPSNLSTSQTSLKLGDCGLMPPDTVHWREGAFCNLLEEVLNQHTCFCVGACGATGNLSQGGQDLAVSDPGCSSR